MFDAWCRFQSRGLFFDPPTCGFSHGQWQVQLPGVLQSHADVQKHSLQLAFSNRDQLFDPRRDAQDMYTSYIEKQMDVYESVVCQYGGESRSQRIASCILEPVLQVTAAWLLARAHACWQAQS